MKVNLIKTKNIVEYRNFYFAEVSKIEYNSKLFGYFYSDKSSNKEWFVLFYNMELENEIILPQNCHFGEDCIYCHDINKVNQLCEIISKINISDKFYKIK